MSKHRATHRTVRRRGRVGAMGLALGVTITVGCAGVVLPQVSAGSATAGVGSARTSGPAAIERATLDPVATPRPEPKVPETELAAANVNRVPALPESSGTGRRIVFDQRDQQVWLVKDGDTVERTYPVSGSRFDNLRPGTYAVQSKSRHATAFDGSGTMEYFVRFATGRSEPIGFHSVPRFSDGRLEQTQAQLGTPLSAGCVRQWMPDAIALWDFADIGTTVVVTP